jgi:hypothetical protein
VVVVIFLEGDRAVFGPRAAEIAGVVYRNLYDHSFFVKPALSSDATATKTSASTN